ncbi:MAG: NAD(P)-binding domain-containing protein [Coprobacter sp.]|nr:NAD(P)-binding domain-containing protein [Coprobacter sp.]
MEKKKVLVTYNMWREGYAELMRKYDVTFPSEGVESFTYDEVLAMIADYDALQSMYDFPVDRRLMDAAPKLKIVSNYAVGYDNIDIPYATERGIQVTNTPDPVTEPTAEQAMGLLLAVSRRISELDRRLRIPGGVKVELLSNLGHTLYGSTLGIIGMGRIGRAFARRAIACGMKIMYHNRHRLDERIERQYGAEYVSLDVLLRNADVVSLNSPHNSETHHMIGEEQLRKMKPTAILINTARGALIDEYALAKALRDGEIWAAGLDVFENGNFPVPELLALDNVVMTPHTGTQTVEVRHEMAAHVSRNIINFFEGGDIDKVNLV